MRKLITCAPRLNFQRNVTGALHRFFLHNDDTTQREAPPSERSPSLLVTLILRANTTSVLVHHNQIQSQEVNYLHEPVFGVRCAATEGAVSITDHTSASGG